MRVELGVAPITCKLRENYMAWTCSQETIADPGERVENMIVDGVRRDRLTKTWDEQLRLES